MKYYILLISAVFALLYTACKKKEVQPKQVETPATAMAYFPLSVGNYWIYEQFETDKNNVIKSLNVYDSVYIVKSETLNNKTVYTVCDQDRINPKPDSLKQYIVDGPNIIGADNHVLLSTTDFTSILEQYIINFGSDTVYISNTQMSAKDVLISTKSGTYLTIKKQTTFSSVSAGCPTVKRYPIFNQYFAKSVGKVYERIPRYCVENGHKRYHRELVRFLIK
ncbi:MAG: hypothetical protein PSX81_00620 [bacterium]|nr:hypothetical protein [bacterium]